MAGRNPFDISNSDAYVGIRGELGKLQAWAAEVSTQSKS